MTTKPQILISIFVAAAVGLVTATAAQPTVDFNRDVRPILSNKCFACHGPDDGQRQAGLRLDDAAVATAELESGTIAIVAGNPAGSELFRRIIHADESQRMPPTDFGKSLSPEQI